MKTIKYLTAAAAFLGATVLGSGTAMAGWGNTLAVKSVEISLDGSNQLVIKIEADSAWGGDCGASIIQRAGSGAYHEGILQSALAAYLSGKKLVVATSNTCGIDALRIID